MVISQVFTPKGVKAKNCPLTTMEVLKVEYAFRDMAIELEQLLPVSPRKERALKLLAASRDACLHEFEPMPENNQKGKKV